MPDVHLGKGATVGSVIGMRGAISPAAVGVDIGCGMGAIRTNLKASQLPDNLKKLREAIEAAIPVGFSQHENMVRIIGSREALQIGTERDALFDEFKNLDRYVKDLDGKAAKQLGTLGGGNHFIEVCLDSGECSVCKGYGCWEQDAFNGDHYTYTVECEACAGKGRFEPNVWLMLHSGSRNIGKTLAEAHMYKAKELEHNIKLPDRDLAVFLAGTPEMKAYRNDLYWAQRYAMLNRRVMFELFKNALSDQYGCVKPSYEAPILCHHNYVAEEKHFGEELIVTRKGAISAAAGQLGIIPGSMGAKSFIVRGLGNPDSLTSASHGAGRRMSRGEAKRKYTLQDLKDQTAGVECRKDSAVIDEIPGAYKDIEQVMRNQSDLVEVVAELKQVLCVKG
jgi:tRNA-splicing ligase RtcB